MAIQATCGGTASSLAVLATSGAGPQTCPKRSVRCAVVRLIVARCEVRYTGRLKAVLPESTRLLIFKSDGSVLVHADAGGYKPLNWMTPPTMVEEEEGLIVVRKRAGKTEDCLEIRRGWPAAEFSRPSASVRRRRRSRSRAGSAASRSISRSCAASVRPS